MTLFCVMHRGNKHGAAYTPSIINLARAGAAIFDPPPLRSPKPQRMTRGSVVPDEVRCWVKLHAGRKKRRVALKNRGKFCSDRAEAAVVGKRHSNSTAGGQRSHGHQTQKFLSPRNCSSDTPELQRASAAKRWPEGCGFNPGSGCSMWSSSWRL